MPPPGGDKQDFPGIKVKAHCLGARKQGKFLIIWIFKIGDQRLVVPIGLHIQVWRLVRGVSGELLPAVELAKESMGMPAIEMQERKLPTGPADVKLRASVMQAGPQQL